MRKRIVSAGSRLSSDPNGIAKRLSEALEKGEAVFMASLMDIIKGAWHDRLCKTGWSQSPHSLQISLGFRWNR